MSSYGFYAHLGDSVSGEGSLILWVHFVSRCSFRPELPVTHQCGPQESFSLQYFMLNVTFRRASQVAQGACQPLQETQVSISGLGRSLGEGNGNLCQYSCLGNLMDRGAWQATVHGMAKSQTQLSD